MRNQEYSTLMTPPDILEKQVSILTGVLNELQNYSKKTIFLTRAENSVSRAILGLKAHLEEADLLINLIGDSNE